MGKMVIFHSKLAHLYKDGDLPGFSMDFFGDFNGNLPAKMGVGHLLQFAIERGT